MSYIPPISVKTYVNGFCSQNRPPLPPARTIEDCINIIMQIIGKSVLCKHDIDDINHLYATMDRLERQLDQISLHKFSLLRSSHFVLENIIKKLDKAVRLKQFTPKGWIRLYHLQNFKHEQLQLKQHFTVLSKTVSKTPADLREIAFCLPFCISKANFDSDVEVLIGKNPSAEVTKILDRKRKKLDNHETLKEIISDKKKQLEGLRQKYPNHYPPYFDELLDHGYIHLYDHLLEMRALSTRNDRSAKIETISFSSLSHIVLETREAIIQKVNDLMPTMGKNVLFLLGGSGAGKSTTLCFLRGDPMVLKGSQYESQNDHDQLIGASATTSCTFLPTIEVVNDLVIIDFPGFDDSNSPLISLGMEYALKALMRKYDAQALVIEAITNIEGKFAAAAQLGSRLKRLFENKKNCFLGITKYSKDPDFKDIQKIEEDQRKELFKPSDKENFLEGQIQALSGLKMPALQPQIQSLQDQLSQLKQEKIQMQQLPLPDTDLKKKSRDELQKRENDLLEQIGLGKIIRFWNLEEPKHVSSCLETLIDPKNEVIRVKPQPKDPIMDPILDAHDKELIKRRFENNLKQEIESYKECYVEFKDVKLFMQHVLESSLINIILSETHPEIGQFFHLPETDSTLVNHFDKAVVKSCIKKYMVSIIGDLNMSLVDTLLEELKTKVSEYKLKTLNNLSNKLRDYILGLLGIRLENPEQAKIKWKELEQEYKSKVKAEEKKWELSPWVQFFMGITGIPWAIHKLLIWKAQSEVEQKAIDDLVSKACEELDRIYKALASLKDLEKIIEKREELDEVIHAMKLSLTSKTDLIKSIRNKINKIREIYGSEDWDKRIETIKESYSHLVRKDGNDSNFLIFNISPLIAAGIGLDDLSSVLQLTNQERLEYATLSSINVIGMVFLGSGLLGLFRNKRFASIKDIISATDYSHPLFHTMVAAALFSVYENIQPSSTAATQTQVINSNVKNQ